MNALNRDEGWQILSKLFGDNNRAEWPLAQFGKIFVEPPYIGKLEAVRPCFLIGGRGTGKTTSLQSLRYDSTYTRLTSANLSFSDQAYFGVLIRMNKNRVHAFKGRKKSEEEWSSLFAHYINLLVCQELVGLAKWLEAKVEASLSEFHLRRICIDLGLSEVRDLLQLEQEIVIAISRLQIYINNPSEKNEVTCSAAEAPLRTMVDVLKDSGLISGQTVFCCFDEYENLLEYQQSVLNTYIKHASPPLSYKVGVRKNGLRSHHTLDGNDVLRVPDDYAEIEIAEEGFELFAKAVAEQRLQFARNQGVTVSEKLTDFLDDLSFSEEVKALGGGAVASVVLEELRATGDNKLYNFFADKPQSETYFLMYWSKTGSESIVDLAYDWMGNPERWDTRIGNYGFASLFWLSVGRKGVRVRKYYCGERVLLTLSGGNIRYFLDILDSAIGIESKDVSQSVCELKLSASSQTQAAREVGKRRLNQLEGLADHGPQLKRMVLAIGKVFFERARSPARGTPEQNSFVLTGPPETVSRLSDLLSEGVGHLAFEVETRTKATTDLELRDDEFRLHRIFSAFFEISHRKKRRTSFDAGKLLAVLEDKPSKAIAELLDGQEQTIDDSLPEQLAFFGGFYGQKDL